MPSEALPNYVRSSKPNSTANRAAWFKNIAPTYAGIFLWIGFYQGLGADTLTRVGLGGILLGLVIAGLISYGLFYYVPAMLGMKTGHPLYIVGTSTFGTTGGYLMPGLLMGLIQIGWFAVGTFIATQYILTALNQNSEPGTIGFAIVSIIWAYLLGFIAVKGIQYVARVATFLNFVPLLILLVVFAKTSSGLSSYAPANPDPTFGVIMTIQLVVGFFATAGAAGTDFGMSSRSKNDVTLGGLTGIALPIVLVGGLALAGVAGAHGLDSSIADYEFGTAVKLIGGMLATGMFLLFAIASVAPGCFSTFIAANSFGTMLPQIPRMTSTMVAVTLAAILSITGVAANLVGFFTIVGASFGPICGAMAADYVLSKGKWAGPRLGINWAGYLAWAVGFFVGLTPMEFMPVSEGVKTAMQPAAVYSFAAGFVVYFLLAKAGLEPTATELPTAEGSD